MENTTSSSPQKKQWHWLTVLLWAYSVFAIFLVILVSSIDSTRDSLQPIETSPADSLIAAIAFAPIFILLIIAGIGNFRKY